MSEPALYILMRTDMESMSPGKAMAQTAHAANAFMYRVNSGVTLMTDTDHWENATQQGFGTTIVLAVDSEEEMGEAIAASSKEGFLADTILDPTYPVRDGYVTHLIPVNTCAYVFTPCRVEHPVSALSGPGLGLHP